MTPTTAPIADLMPVERSGEAGRFASGPTVVVGDAEDDVEEDAEVVEDLDVLEVR
jgi:hypothetical protein